MSPPWMRGHIYGIQALRQKASVNQVDYDDFADNDLTTDPDDGTMLTVDDNHGQTVEIKHTPSGKTAKTDELTVVIPAEPEVIQIITYDPGVKASTTIGSSTVI